MKRKWKSILYVLLAAAVLGGVLALCLWEREPQGDTDPNAPFVDLPDSTKKEVLKAIAEYKEEHPRWAPDEIFWYGELKPGQETPLTGRNYKYGVQYYGTFGGYHIVLSPIVSTGMGPGSRSIGDYRFDYGDSFLLYAYKNGKVRLLSEVYEEGLLNDEQIERLHQCYERFRQEIYPYLKYY